MTGSFNQRLALRVTRIVGTMACGYLFITIAIIGFPGFPATLPQYVQWFSGTFLQLVMLPILAVGTAQLGRHQEVQANEEFDTTTKIYADIETLVEQNNRIIEMLLRSDTGPFLSPRDTPHD